jgi:hypothetical protein
MNVMVYAENGAGGETGYALRLPGRFTRIVDMESGPNLVDATTAEILEELRRRLDHVG